MAQDWSAELFGALKGAGGKAYSNYAVGYNNVKVPDGTKNGIAIGNTPGEAARIADWSVRNPGTCCLKASFWAL